MLAYFWISKLYSKYKSVVSYVYKRLLLQMKYITGNIMLLLLK